MSAAFGHQRIHGQPTLYLPDQGISALVHCVLSKEVGDRRKHGRVGLRRLMLNPRVSIETMGVQF